MKTFLLIDFVLGGLPSDPRTWGREEVTQFLQYCEKEFDLEKIDMDRFQMNGKSHRLQVVRSNVDPCQEKPCVSSLKMTWQSGALEPGT